VVLKNQLKVSNKMTDLLPPQKIKQFIPGLTSLLREEPISPTKVKMKWGDVLLYVLSDECRSFFENFGKISGMGPTGTIPYEGRCQETYLQYHRYFEEVGKHITQGRIRTDDFAFALGGLNSTLDLLTEQTAALDEWYLRPENEIHS